MSGIFGLVNLDGAPVEHIDMVRMAYFLERRGPERTGVWRDDSVGLGHTLLSTTPEEQHQVQPIRHRSGGVVITGDVRLDNRDELIDQLGLDSRSGELNDAGLAMESYLRWGESCVEHFLGDFAFAVWDDRRRSLFCARDQMGMRTLYYHHQPGRLIAVATSAKAIVVLPQVPYRIAAGRIADFLVNPLEGIDKTSTFFEGVFRLPPAHTLSVDARGARLREYWRLEPADLSGLRSDESYCEAFIDVFGSAVRSRLRAPGPVGSMLSGGMDSTSVAAMAAEILASEHRGPLHTFSATSPDGDADNETRHIEIARRSLAGIDSHTVRWDELDALQPELSEVMRNIDEPFDLHMTLLEAMYLSARRAGVVVVLDGVGGDVSFSAGRYLARLMRSGRVRAAYREVEARNTFWDDSASPTRAVARAGLQAATPLVVRRSIRLAKRKGVDQADQRMIDPDFARRVDVSGRLAAFGAWRPQRPLGDRSAERADVLRHPLLSNGRERYDRVAAAAAIEPRDPFLDRRVASFCVALPDHLVIRAGWPKFLLRESMQGRVPDEIRWRRGRDHLGWPFTRARIDVERSSGSSPSRGVSLAGYVHERLVTSEFTALADLAETERVAEVLMVETLARWMDVNSDRPALAGELQNGRET